MDREEALALLKGGHDGVAEWNERRSAGEKIPDLSEENLVGLNLGGANLSWGRFRMANFRNVDLIGANLSHARLCDAHFSGANLNGANLFGADLSEAQFLNANLAEAKLANAELTGANFSGANLEGARLNGATASWTAFPEMLGMAAGLDEVIHEGPSFVPLGALRSLKEQVPELFLRGCGLKDFEIEFARSQAGNPVQFYDCFISYCTQDEEFATRLYNDLQGAGVRCWKWNEDAKTGKSLWGEINQAIRTYDKLILIASKASLSSPAVNREIERAIVQEDEREKAGGDKDVLFPIRLDDFVFEGWQHERKVDVTQKVIADACGWGKNPAKYKTVLERVLRDLQTETGV